VPVPTTAASAPSTANENRSASATVGAVASNESFPSNLTPVHFDFSTAPAYLSSIAAVPHNADKPLEKAYEVLVSALNDSRPRVRLEAARLLTFGGLPRLIQRSVGKKSVAQQQRVGMVRAGGLPSNLQLAPSAAYYIQVRNLSAVE
jgi:hypothetical protein